jgi:phosphoglycolate phosphatase
MQTPDLTLVRGLIFDLDGTLIDSKADLIHSVNAMLREKGRAELPAETVASYIGNGAPQLVARAMGNNVSEEAKRSALEFFLAYYETHKMDTTVPYPGVAEALEQLAALPMAVLTNKPVRISVRILEEMKLAKYFRAIYGGNSFEKKKPDPTGTNAILGELGMKPREVLFVGDSEVDVQTARNAGTWAATVNFGFGAHDRTAHPPDLYLERMTDLVALLGVGKAAGT